MAIKPTQPQSIGAVLDTSFQLYKASLTRVLPICLLLVLGSVPQGIYVLMVPGTPSELDPLGTLSQFTRPGYWLTTLLALVLSLWAVGALYIKQHAIGTDQELTIGEALQRSLGRILPLFLMSILFGLALTVGFILLIVPGVILSVSLILGSNLCVLEGKGPVAGLIGSHRLVWGDWWRTAVILTVGIIIFIVLYLAIGLVVGMIVPFVASSEDLLMYTFVSSLVLGAIMSFIASPYYVALLIAIYWDLKQRKEGGDLATRVGALNAA